MQAFLYENRKKIIISIVAACLIGVIVFIYFNYFIFRVTSVSPNLNNSLSPSTQAITVTFNRPLKGTSVTLNATNNLQPSTTIKGKILTINIPEGMNLNSSYTITIASVTATDGTNLKNVTLKFKTNNDPTLTSDQLNIALKRQQENLPSAYNDPVYKALPYTGDQYVIQAHLEAPTSPKEDSSVGIEIIVYLNDSQEGDNRDQAIESIENAAMAHLNTIPNVDLSTYYIYDTIQDPLT